MRIALVHDYLTQRGGAERVLQALHDLWPDSPVLTSVVDQAVLPAPWRDWDIQAHPLGQFQVAQRDHRLLFPFYPAIFRSLGRQIGGVEAVISDSSAWAHRIAVPVGIPHVCYCHSPARFLWNDSHYLEPSGIPRMLLPAPRGVAAWMRRGDVAAAARVDQYVANSAVVAARIQAAYGVRAPVIYPPVDVARFAHGDEQAMEDWFLVVSRLVPHKRIDLAIEACRQIGAPLHIIGTGRHEPALRRMAGPGATFHGALSNEDVVARMSRCRALIVPGVEDFGITAVEAQAAGRPVVTVRAGGALETVIDEVTGLYFDESSPASLGRALVLTSSRTWNPAIARENAARFAVERFQAEMMALLKRVIGERAAIFEDSGEPLEVGRSD